MPHVSPALAESRLIVIGTSAGGDKALRSLLGALPPSLAAPVLVVRHLSAGAGPYLVKSLEKHIHLPCTEAGEGMRLERGRVYFAPADSHLIVKDDVLHLTHGPAENRWRPSIDVLFRSAAVSHRARVIGVVLTGYLSDGSVGLNAVKRCGGITIVQDPADAEYPDMPRHALVHVSPDYCVPLPEMGALLERLLSAPPKPEVPVPKDIAIEVDIASRVAGSVREAEAWGARSLISCPDCGGALWETEDGESLKYRCHVGHAFGTLPLLAAQSTEIEKTLWTALRMFEERKVILSTMASREKNPLASLQASISEIEKHASRIRGILHAGSEISHLPRETQSA